MTAGFEGQLGFKSESVWGTAVTVDQFHPGFLSEALVRDQPPLVSQGIRAGRRTPTSAQAGPKTVSGPVELELFNEPLATLLTHMFGNVVTTGAGPYTHTADPGAVLSKSFTLQVGVADVGGTVRAFTFSGCKLPRWTISANAGEIAKLSLDVSAKDYVTGTALASASYGTGVPFMFIDGSVSIDGNTIATVESFELTCQRPLRVKHALGAATIIEQVETGQSEYRISVTPDFEDLTLHDLANTEVATVLTFNNGSETFTITTNTFVMPKTPSNDGVNSLASEEFEGVILGTSDSNAIQAVLVNDETSAT